MARDQGKALGVPQTMEAPQDGKEPLRLLYLVFNRSGRGTYWRALGFGEALAQRGHQVTLLSAAQHFSDGSSERDVADVREVQLPDLHRGSGYDPWHLLQRLRWLRRRAHDERFDLVHLFETRPVNLFPGLYLQRTHRVPLFTDWCDWFGRGGSVEERPNALLRGFLRPVETFFEERYRTRARATTVINSTLQRKSLRMGVAPERILLLPNGANVQEIKPQPRADVRRRLGLDGQRCYLGYTGSIFERDAQLMARAFDRICAVRNDVTLLMIGYCNISIKSLVNNPDAVVESGAISYRQLADYVAAADIGWLPLADTGANRGRFPMKAHDFIAAGQPLLVSDVGDLGDFVQQYGIGRVAPDDAQAQAQAALALLDDGRARETMGRQARRVAVEERAWPVVAGKLEQFYYRQLSGMAEKAKT